MGVSPILVVPAAGLSTRLNLGRPKFLLQHPTGVTMLSAGLLGLKGAVRKVILVTLAEHLEGISLSNFGGELEAAAGAEVEIIRLEHRTGSMVETISAGLRRLPEDSFIVTKDCDNYVQLREGSLSKSESFIATANLDSNPGVDPRGKSFVRFDDNHRVIDIQEKRITSQHINTGLVGFSSAEMFLRASHDLSIGNREVFVSDLIRVMIEEGHTFWTEEIEKYEDWGTTDAWLSYVRKFGTLFLDLDGVVAYNSNRLAESGHNWGTVFPIPQNLAFLLQISETEKVSIVFTTSRSEQHRSTLAKQLRELGFRDFQLVMGLPHAQRVLVNDFAPTNPYPSASSINVPRDSHNLEDYLGSFFRRD